MSEWRQRRADRENNKRLVQYQQSLRQWQRDGELIQRYHRLAQHPPVQPVQLGMVLRSDERLLWTAPRVSLTELPDTMPLPAPAHTGYCPKRQSRAYIGVTPPAHSLRDQGTLAVTNQRIVFNGDKYRRRWPLATVTGLAHGARMPVSLIRVWNQCRLSGLVFSADNAAGFQFFVSLALADFHQDKAGFIAHLAALHHRHQLTRPQAPQAAGPRQPSNGVFPGLLTRVTAAHQRIFADGGPRHRPV